jgi:hypothetical protein
MKRILPILSLVAIAALLFTACKSNTQSAAENQLKYEDTVGLSQFQAWKAQNERIQPEYAVAPVTAPVRKATRTRSSGTKSGSMSSTSSNQAKTTQKKGWSKSAKYAVIGGVAGGAAGAIINKRNRAVGAVVGAVIGAGGGYVLGRSQDKKDGRIELQ